MIIGDVKVGKNSSIWPYTVLRGDVSIIRVGDYSNIQDGSILHGVPVYEYNPLGCCVDIGNYVSIGHKCVIHGAKIKNNCLIGIGSVVLDDTEIQEFTILDVNSLVKPGTILESGYFYSGSPVQKIRELSSFERTLITDTAKSYANLKNEYI